MDALHAAISKIRLDPTHPTARTLSALIIALDSGERFDLNELYRLNYKDFSLAVELMKQWRLDSFRYERGWATRAVSGSADSHVELPAWMHRGRERPAVTT
jgi:hypothetical protein